MEYNLLPVILAAGLGRRLSQNVDFSSYPKGLAKIADKSLIEYQLDVLDEFGVDKVLIVVGHLEDRYRDYFGSNYKGLDVFYVVNSEYAVSGSALSLYKAESFWRANKQPILMLHADIFFDPEILRETLFDQRKNILVVDEDYVNATNDEQVILGRNSLVDKLEKGPDIHPDIVGESVAINIFSVDLLDQYFPYLQEVTQKDKKINWEQTIEGFIAAHPDTSLFYRGISKRLWVNINYLDDFEYARDTIFSAINAQ